MAETPPPPSQDPSVRTDVPQPPPPDATERRAGAGARVGAVVLALIFAFACAVMVAVMIDIGDTPTCEAVESGEATLEPGENECFDSSETAKTASLILGWPSAVLAGLTVLLAIAFAIRGRGGRPLAIAAVAAVVLGGLSILVGSI
jgi:hypothetical protein